MCRQSDGTITFTITNTGDGIEFHDLNGNKVYQLSYIGLSEDNLNEEFFKGIFEFVKSKKSMKDVYEFIDEKLNKGANKTDGRLMKAQRGGVCSWKSLSTWVHGQISPGQTSQNRDPAKQIIYEKFKLNIFQQKLQLLVENQQLQSVITDKVRLTKKKPLDSVANLIYLLFLEIFNPKEAHEWFSDVYKGPDALEFLKRH
ncbi:MAG: hypothetical protein H0W88_01360 [Parachlamydiaceae bacterium]|nr:hypothetical protein [Parachlamydiaceae bacterium]